MGVLPYVPNQVGSQLVAQIKRAKFASEAKICSFSIAPGSQPGAIEKSLSSWPRPRAPTLGDARTLTAAQSHPRPPCDVPRTLAASAKLARNPELAVKPQLPTAARPTPASMSSQASICAIVAQTEARLQHLRFITGKLKLQQHTCSSSGS